MTSNRPGRAAAPTPDELREQVETTREQLGVTVEALAAKADIRARAQDRAAAVKGQVRDTADHAARTARRNRGPLVAAGAAAVVLAMVVLVHRSRRC